jgi:hypothetical protein
MSSQLHAPAERAGLDGVTEQKNLRNCRETNPEYSVFQPTPVTVLGSDAP